MLALVVGGLTACDGSAPTEPLQDAAGGGGFSSSVTSIEGAPDRRVKAATPSAASGTGISDSEILVTWIDASDNEDQFIVQRWIDRRGKWVAQGFVDVNGERFVDDGLSPSTTYLYRIRACNPAGCNSTEGFEGSTLERGAMLEPEDIPAGPEQEEPTTPEQEEPTAHELDQPTVHPPSSDEGVAATGYPNQPAGFQKLSETSYSSGREGGFSSSSNQYFSIIRDGGAPRSASSVAEARFPTGFGGGYSPVWSDTHLSDSKVTRLYISFWVKISGNWQGHRSGVNKIGFAWMRERPAVYANLYGFDSGRLTPEMRLQGLPDGARNLTPNRGDPEFHRGRWHRWEILLVANSGGNADGRVQWWIDGREAGRYDDVRFGRSGESRIWNYATWRPVWGGRGDTVERAMSMWMDHYYVAGAR